MNAPSPQAKPGQALSFPPKPGIDVDAVIIGAGFSGIRTLIEMKRLGLNAIIIESGPDIGGTWYWNRYPGARTDSQAWVYGFPLDEIRFDWRWTERYSTQAQTHDYITHVANTFNLWPSIRLNTSVESATFDEEQQSWIIGTDEGSNVSARFVFTATGQLSQPHVPKFDGLSDFTGDVYQTQYWPEGGVDFTDKRVAIVGTGATAVQVIPIVAKQAKDLKVFQRTANYVLPARNDALSDHDIADLRANSDEIWERAFTQPFGMDIKQAGRLAADFTPEEQLRILERGWEIGGFRFLFETFDDIFSDDGSNAVASDFIRGKIRSIVDDPETADLLCPKGYPLGNKRPPLGNYYYETFNRDNVSLVDISANPVTIEPTGIRVGDEFHEVDAIIFATGYDAITGTLARIDIRGRNGVALKDRWTNGPQTYFSMLVDGFPNLFMVAGPQSPFANIPMVTEYTVRWLSKLLKTASEKGSDLIEPKPESVEQFRQLVEAVTDATVFRRDGVRNWFLGSNIPGKAEATVMWLGGLGTFGDACDVEVNSGYSGLEFEKTADKQAASLS
ncbi:flavin-containing monooxygenase [Rhodococcus erythropolis]|uniref:flavin-containing monooxygenase n=1 Tax=Rhodococcus erythropolis TaxID=1833 RepID=UPI00380ADC87